MQAAYIAVAALVVAVVGRMLWTWRGGSRRGRGLVPLEGGWGEPLRFWPGPALLPEHDDDREMPWPQPSALRKYVHTAPASATSLCPNPFMRPFSPSGDGMKGVTGS
jgi:hypothetical protein